MTQGNQPTLAVLTSGGDAPGMNMAVHALTEHAERAHWQVLGVREGLQGLLQADFTPLETQSTAKYTRYGGTFLGSSRLPDFSSLVPEFQKVLKTHNITHLAVIGGNGSFRAAALLSAFLPVAALPGTIDNDVTGTELSIGFDTALNTGLTLLDGMRDSAESLPRLFALETLGGDTGFLAQAVAEAGGADLLLVPEQVLTEDAIYAQLQSVTAARRYALIVAAEGYPDLSGVLERASVRLATRIRVSRAGHAQRGGRPTASDRLLASRLATAAFERLQKDQSGAALWQRGRAVTAPFELDAQSKAFPAPRRA